MSTTDKHDGVPAGTKWLALGSARAMLGINHATLRQWADEGRVRAFRTPGGHRRFAVEDLRALLRNAGGPRTGRPRVERSQVLPRMRHLAAQGAHPSPPAWLHALDGAAQRRLRARGRALLELCLAAVSNPHDRRQEDAAQRLGASYGEDLAGHGVAVGQAVEAFVFFRDATLSAVRPGLAARGVSPREVGQAWQRLSHLTDRVLVGLAGAYDASSGRPGGVVGRKR